MTSQDLTCGIRWTEFNSKDQLVTKQKMFASEESRDAFVAKLEGKPNFNQITCWTDY